MAEHEAILVDEARKELAELLDDLFVKELKASHAAVVKRTEENYTELKRKQEGQTAQINALQAEFRKLREEVLPEYFEALPKLKALQEMEQSLTKLQRESQEGLTERMNGLKYNMDDQFDGRTRDLITALVEHHQGLLSQTTSVLDRTADQIRSEVAAGHEQTRGRVDEAHVDVRAVLEQGRRGQEGHQKVVETLQESERRRNWLVISVAVLLALITLLSGAVAFRVFGG